MQPESGAAAIALVVPESSTKDWYSKRRRQKKRNPTRHPMKRKVPRYGLLLGSVTYYGGSTRRSAVCVREASFFEEGEVEEGHSMANRRICEPPEWLTATVDVTVAQP